jgi:hypothetical protein
VLDELTTDQKTRPRAAPGAAVCTCNPSGATPSAVVEVGALIVQKGQRTIGDRSGGMRTCSHAPRHSIARFNRPISSVTFDRPRPASIILSRSRRWKRKSPLWIVDLSKPRCPPTTRQKDEHSPSSLEKLHLVEVFRTANKFQNPNCSGFHA